MAGAIALERLQAGLETVRFTPVPATRKVYGERGTTWYEEVKTEEFLAENTGSYIANFRHVVAEKHATLNVPFFVTGADLAWWGQLAWKGSVAATGPTSGSVYTYAFTPSLVADDLKFATFEGYSDTQGVQLPGCMVNKLEISWQAGSSVKGTADILCQQATYQAVTAAVPERTGLNVWPGTTAKVYIDAGGGTIGTTQALNVLSGKITWDNQGKQIYHNIGNLYPDDLYRLPRSVQVELDVHYNTQTELTAFDADTERLIRVVLTGPMIPASNPSTPESATMDFYGYWQTAAFGVSDAIRTVKLTGTSQYDTTALYDWKVSIANALATLP
jgi:hypothetical protein